MEFVLEEGKTLPGDSSSLILPALSIGNVGQLAVDLLISSTRAARIGYLDDPNVLPCVGNDPYSPDSPGLLTLPLEAYTTSSNALTLVQQRSPIKKGMMVEFSKNLADFAVATGKKHVVVLSSLDFVRWQKVDMSSGLQIYYLSSASEDGRDEECERRGWKRLIEYSPDGKGWKYLRSIAAEKGGVDSLDEDEMEEEDYYYPSLPFAALFSCLKAKGVKVSCLMCYCSEGDNIQEAFQLAEAACSLMGVNPDSSGSSDDAVEGEKWVIPHSWKTVYGPPPDMSMF
ncbi:proteasome assembly chaperone 2 [Impatiens glandulifera]|uniref:proteasome assembly chaperone 2 n=1 Tax=Impatiens glandulifera TaxID=253017 RepID=UPI001FB15C25|nr:proteasome assembly chaperone 2 [Impatiens glandulifera]